jgi:hypothetical protein
MFGKELKIGQSWFNVSVNIVDKRTGTKQLYCESINAFNIDEILNTNVGGYNPNLYNFENWTIILVGSVTQKEVDSFAAKCNSLANTLDKQKWPLD